MRKATISLLYSCSLLWLAERNEQRHLDMGYIPWHFPVQYPNNIPFPWTRPWTYKAPPNNSCFRKPLQHLGIMWPPKVCVVNEAVRYNPSSNTLWPWYCMCVVHVSREHRSHNEDFLIQHVKHAIWQQGFFEKGRQVEFWQQIQTRGEMLVTLGRLQCHPKALRGPLVPF